MQVPTRSHHHPLTHLHQANNTHICPAVSVSSQDPGYVIQQALAAQSKPTQQQLLQQYAGHLRQQLIEAINHPQHRVKPLTGLHIAVDAGNGSGGFFASQVCMWGTGSLFM